jgi:hypothetical protein
MQLKKFSFLLEALTPIAHHEGSFGNTATVMRRRVRQLDGSWCELPIITGDTLRHGLREASSYAFLDAAGLLEAEALGEAAIRLLFSGGMVTGRGDASNIKLDAFREMCELCPPLALLGGCTDNRVVPGRMNVDDASLVCEENARYLPEWALEWHSANHGPLDSFRAHLEEVQRVRMDPALDPGKRKLMLPEHQIEVSNRLMTGEQAHAEDATIERADSKSSMMPRRFERVAQGSLFHWSLTATCYSDLDVDTLHTMLACFLSDPRVGGKRGTGHGQLRVVAARDVAVARLSEPMTGFELGPTMGALFRQHVAERRERIRKWLQVVNS